MKNNYTYDTNGLAASKIDWEANATTNINGQELSPTEANGTSQARKVTTDWRTDYNLPERTTEPSRITDVPYDINNRLLLHAVTEL